MRTKTTRQAGGKRSSAKDQGEVSPADLGEKKMAPASKAGKETQG